MDTIMKRILAKNRMNLTDPDMSWQSSLNTFSQTILMSSLMLAIPLEIFYFGISILEMVAQKNCREQYICAVALVHQGASLSMCTMH